MLPSLAQLAIVSSPTGMDGGDGEWRSRRTDKRARSPATERKQPSTEERARKSYLYRFDWTPLMDQIFKRPSGTNITDGQIRAAIQAIQELFVRHADSLFEQTLWFNNALTKLLIDDFKRIYDLVSNRNLLDVVDAIQEITGLDMSTDEMKPLSDRGFLNVRDLPPRRLRPELKAKYLADAKARFESFRSRVAKRVEDREAAERATRTAAQAAKEQRLRAGPMPAPSSAGPSGAAQVMDAGEGDEAEEAEEEEEEEEAIAPSPRSPRSPAVEASDNSDNDEGGVGQRDPFASSDDEAPNDTPGNGPGSYLTSSA